MKHIVRLMVLFLLSNTLYKLIDNGTITYYINPKFLPMTKVALLFIVILFFLSVINLLFAVLKGDFHGSLYKAPIFVLFAFSTTLLFTPQAFSSSMVQQKGMLNLKSAPVETTNPSNLGVDNKAKTADGEISKYQQADKKTPQLTEKNKIELTNDNFVVKYAQIYRSPQNYAGKEIEMEGFIVHNPNIGNDKYLIIRYIMVCCAADAQVLGFIAKGSAPFPDGSWVKITGKFAVENNQPYLQILNAKLGKVPDNPYLLAPEGLPDS